MLQSHLQSQGNLGRAYSTKNRSPTQSQGNLEVLRTQKTAVPRSPKAIWKCFRTQKTASPTQFPCSPQALLEYIVMQFHAVPCNSGFP